MDNQRGRAFVIGQEKPEEELYVKDYGTLPKTGSTATGDFAELLDIQKSALSDRDADTGTSDYASYLKDTIGMMGFQNGLREKLGNTGFTLFE